MKKMLAILASPRKKGNAAKMLDTAISKARDNGYEIEFVNLYEKNIAWCKGCMACKQTQMCVFEDDIQKIGKLLKECDLVVVASPAYFANISAPLKNMFDRLVGLVMDDNSGLIPKPRLSPQHKYFILVTCNTPSPFDRLTRQSTGVVFAVKEFFNISGMKYAGAIVFAGTRNKTELPEQIIRKIQAKIERC